VSAEVIQLRDGAPLLSDIPGMLRQLADQIEAGEHGEVRTAFLLLPVAGGYPAVFGWGDVEGENHPALQCDLAKMWLLTNIVSRSA
jgi:hypothetical protein